MISFNSYSPLTKSTGTSILLATKAPETSQQLPCWTVSWYMSVIQAVLVIERVVTDSNWRLAVVSCRGRPLFNVKGFRKKLLLNEAVLFPGKNKHFHSAILGLWKSCFIKTRIHFFFPAMVFFYTTANSALSGSSDWKKQPENRHMVC